ncbi:hypothetical protein [Roseobacter sp. A03A-229]
MKQDKSEDALVARIIAANSQISAHSRLNDWFSRSTAAWEFILLQQHSRCKRMQHKINKSGLGSSPILAARCTSEGATSPNWKFTDGIRRPGRGATPTFAVAARTTAYDIKYSTGILGEPAQSHRKNTNLEPIIHL